MEPTKDKVLARLKSLQGGKIKDLEPILCRVSGVRFYNTSRFTFEKLKGDPDKIAANLTHYIKGFSTHAREILEHFGFEEHIGKLDKANRLYLIVLKFAEIDLHPDTVPNIEMGYIFEELIRRFNEACQRGGGRPLHSARSDPPDGEPALRAGRRRADHARVSSRPSTIPACGTGGMLSVADEYRARAQPRRPSEGLRPGLQRRVLRHLRLGHADQGPGASSTSSSATASPMDRLPRPRFDYMLANPPFGVEWKPQEQASSARSTTSRASAAASAPGCPASTTARCSSSST